MDSGNNKYVCTYDYADLFDLWLLVVIAGTQHIYLLILNNLKINHPKDIWIYLYFGKTSKRAGNNR